MSAQENAHYDSLEGMQRQNDFVRQYLDTSLKLSLLSEAWHALQRGHLMEPYRAEDFARRLCADLRVVTQQLDQLVADRLFERLPAERHDVDTYAITTDPVRRDALRRFLSSWGDVRVRMRANATFAFRPGNDRKAA